MNSKTDHRRESAIAPPSFRNENAQPSGLIARWKQMWQFLTDYLFKGDELQVWQKCDRHGNTWWEAYDPVSGRSLSYATEQEVRMWLEQVRYRQHFD
ncbi:MAG: hypothetical protein MUF49_20880 [Oculatellaceae cyanobacterium Prado106]|nr:hypothetical protein [Oculatellaceae cyanobacterium Prado106]